MLDDVMGRVAGGVGFLGGSILVFGLVQLGLALRSQDGPGGGQIATAIGMIVGGGVIIGAAVYFGTLDTSWAR